MKFTFTVEVEVERTTGKFASRDEIAEQILEWIEGCNEGEISGVGADCESEYEIAEWSAGEAAG